MSSHLGYTVYKTGGKKRAILYNFIAINAEEQLPVGKKRLSQKEEKTQEAFSAAHNFELPGSLPSDAH
jgi:hypothetical protein